MKTAKRLERIVAPGRRHWVGDAFHVHNFIPALEGLSMRSMDPFIMLDYNPLMHVEGHEPPRGVGVHPHRGFETVTVAYAGEVQHHDSGGGGGVISTGDVQWMTAGSGVLHKEYYAVDWARKGGDFQMVQLWVNLPAKDKMTTPRYQAIANSSMARIELGEGSYMELIAGEFGGAKGPAMTFSPIHLSNLHLRKGQKVELDFPAEWNTAILAVRGSAVVQGEALPLDNLAKFANEGETITVEASEDGIFLVMSGQPFNEPIAPYGPFVMNTPEELKQAFIDFNAGKFGQLED